MTATNPYLKESIALKRIAEELTATTWFTEQMMDIDAASTLLEVMPDEVSLLCALGYLKADWVGANELKIPLSEIVRFYETHGEWWFTLRAQKQLARLRAMVVPPATAHAA